MADLDFTFDFLFGTVNVVQDEQKMAQSPLVGSSLVSDLEVDHGVGAGVSFVVEEGLGEGQ